jgi:hypothetical protein
LNICQEGAPGVFYQADFDSTGPPQVIVAPHTMQEAIFAPSSVFLISTSPPQEHFRFTVSIFSPKVMASNSPLGVEFVMVLPRATVKYEVHSGTHILLRFYIAM